MFSASTKFQVLALGIRALVLHLLGLCVAGCLDREPPHEPRPPNVHEMATLVGGRAWIYCYADDLEYIFRCSVDSISDPKKSVQDRRYELRGGSEKMSIPLPRPLSFHRGRINVGDGMSLVPLSQTKTDALLRADLEYQCVRGLPTCAAGLAELNLLKLDTGCDQLLYRLVKSAETMHSGAIAGKLGIIQNPFKGHTNPCEGYREVNKAKWAAKRVFDERDSFLALCQSLSSEALVCMGGVTPAKPVLVSPDEKGFGAEQSLRGEFCHRKFPILTELYGEISQALKAAIADAPAFECRLKGG